jgi:hypothetical protein
MSRAMIPLPGLPESPRQERKPRNKVSLVPFGRHNDRKASRYLLQLFKVRRQIFHLLLIFNKQKQIS